MESPWHRAAIDLLIAVVSWFWRERSDFYVGGNMFLYYFRRPRRKPLVRGPDFFYVKGVERFVKRDKWVYWDEGKYPHVVVELLSPSTAKVDRTTKKDIYEALEIDEYLLYDPATRVCEGWRLNIDKKYETIAPNELGQLWCASMGMWFGNWAGAYRDEQANWPRFYDASGSLILHQAEAEQLRAEAEQKRVDAEKKRADAEKKRADAEKKRANAQKKRADNLERELTLLRERLAQLERDKNG